MSLNSDIAERLKKIVKTKDEIFLKRAIVTDVDLVNYTCTCIPFDIGGDLLNVQIIPRDKDGNIQKAVVIVPSVGAVVWVNMFNNDDGCIVGCSDISTIMMAGDKFGGLIKIEELVKKLNNLEDLVNDLSSKYNSHTHTVSVTTTCPAGSGTGNGTAIVTTTPEATVLTPTQKTDIENSTIKHGDGKQ